MEQLIKDLEDQRVLLVNKVKAIDSVLVCYGVDITSKEKLVHPFKINETIKIEAKKTRKIYPFLEMKVGDSFVFGEYSRPQMTKASNAGRNWAYNAKSEYKFATRKTDDNMIRIFRTK